MNQSPVTSINSFGEEYTCFSSHKHPENPNFMQVVFYHIWVKNQKTTIVYNLGSNGKNYYIFNMSKDECIAKYSEKDTSISTEEEFEKWLSSKNKLK